MQLDKTSLLIFLTFISLLSLFSLSLAVPPPGGPAGSIGIGPIHAGGNQTSSTGEKCGNSMDSCGTWPNCTNITGVSFCKDGKLAEFYCSSNQIKVAKKSVNCLELKMRNENGDEDEAEITVYRSGGSVPISAVNITGSENITSTYDYVDLEVSYDDSNFRFKAKRVNFERLASKPANITIDFITPDINNLIVYGAYKVELPADFSYNSIELRMEFDPDEVENTSALSFYKCSSYDFVNEQCNGNWVKISSRVEGNVVIADITSFSAYALGESGTTTTTTTTTSSQTTTTTSSPTTTSSQTTTTTQPSPSSSGSSGSNTGGGGGSGVFITSTTSSTTTTTPTTTTTTQVQQQKVENKTEETQQKTTGRFVLTPEVTQIALFITSIPIGLISLFLMKKYKLYGERIVRYVPRSYKTESKGYMIKTPKGRKGKKRDTVLQL